MPRKVRGGASETGKQALATFKRKVAERLIDALDERDPELLTALNDVGVVQRGWAAGGDRPIHAPPGEVVERMLERQVERRPSLVASLGLTAVQLLSSGQRPLGPTDTAVPERLTVMFTDLEGFTTFTAREGDEAASDMLVAHQRAVGPVIRSRGGRIMKRLGDGFLLTFAQPEAAVLAALELVSTEPGPLRLRAGLHVGEVMVMADDIIGNVVNIAARVTELAKGGQVLLTADVYDAVKDGLGSVAFTRPRRRHLKGLDEPVGLCRASLA
jgi:class 3 adenylate cyclase